MTSEFKKPGHLPEKKEVAENLTAPVGMTRREVLSKATKAAYAAPVLTALALIPQSAAAISEPPPPPGGQVTAEDMKKKAPNRRK